MTVSFYLYKHLQGMGIQYTCIIGLQVPFVLSKSYNLNWGSPDTSLESPKCIVADSDGLI